MLNKKPVKDYYDPLPGCLLTLLLAGSAILCTPALYLFWNLDPWNIRTPSDQTLTMTFNLHRSSFERLRNMLLEDEQKGIDSVSFESAQTAIGGRRGTEYASLIKEIGSIDNITSHPPRNSVQFIFAKSLEGPIGTDWMKGIAYIPENEQPGWRLVSSLDKVNKSFHSDTYLRRIDSEWFLILNTD